MHATGCVTSLRASANGIWLNFSKPFVRSPSPSFVVRHHDRRVAIQARARLLRRLLALGVSLVVEHEGVPAFLAEILRESVTRPHRFQARILFEARLRDDRARVGLRGRARHRFAPAVTRAH